MPSLFSRIRKAWGRFMNDKGLPTSYEEELSRQCRLILLVGDIIYLFAWLPYIPIDIALHPSLPVIPILRVSLSVVGLAGLLLFFSPAYRARALWASYIQLGYLVVVTGILTGLTGGDPVYMGGYLFIIMTTIIVPLKRWMTWSILAMTFAAFLFFGMQQGMSFRTQAGRYILNDYIITMIVASVFTFFLDSLRYNYFKVSADIAHDRGKLKGHNDLMEKELSLARTIQQKLIPSRSPGRHVYSLYKPMSQLGGDFFDFISFRDSNRLGIFVSDVSGHGVPAAFITSMVKSFIQQAGDIREHPRALMEFLNEQLYNQTAGNFVTAFYGIYDPSDRSFVYANAGHNPPYIISPAGLNQMTSEKRGMPLSILHNDELVKLRKIFHENRIILEKPSRIILYTDGLVEAVNIQSDAGDFESMALAESFLEARDMPPNEFVAHIYSKLVEFRGSEIFDDDVCLICLDV